MYREQLSHCVADRRARGKYHAAPAVLLLQPAGAHEHGRSPLALPGRDAFNAIHASIYRQTLVLVAFVYHKHIDAKVVERHRPVLSLGI